MKLLDFFQKLKDKYRLPAFLGYEGQNVPIVIEDSVQDTKLYLHFLHYVFVISGLALFGPGLSALILYYWDAVIYKGWLATSVMLFLIGLGWAIFIIKTRDFVYFRPRIEIDKSDKQILLYKGRDTPSTRQFDICDIVDIDIVEVKIYHPQFARSVRNYILKLIFKSEEFDLIQTDKKDKIKRVASIIEQLQEEE